MLVLQTFPPILGLRSASPFTVKAEALLRMSGLPFEREIVADPRKAPRGKLPVLVDDGTAIPDSAHIQAHLERVHGADFDGGLDPKQRATATAFRRLVEHHLYFIAGDIRWRTFPREVRDSYFASVPAPLRPLVFRLARRSVERALHGQGLGRHTAEERLAFGREDLDAIAAELGDRPFFLDDRPRSIDATLFGALHGLLDCTLQTPLSEHARGKANLVAYTRRFEETVFGD